jgi:hypothetical protein
VVTNARAYYTTRAAAGATGARLSLRPLIFEGHCFLNNSGASRRGKAKLYLTVIAVERSDEAIHSFFAATWIASRSLSSGAHSRDPLARNDGFGADVAILKLNPSGPRWSCRQMCMTQRTTTASDFPDHTPLLGIRSRPISRPSTRRTPR